MTDRTGNLLERLQKGRESAQAPCEMLKLALEDRGLSDCARIEGKFKTIPNSFQKLYVRALKGKSLKAAIKYQCSECCGWDRATVKDCACVGCALYLHRPFR